MEREREREKIELLATNIPHELFARAEKKLEAIRRYVGEKISFRSTRHDDLEAAI